MIVSLSEYMYILDIRQSDMTRNVTYLNFMPQKRGATHHSQQVSGLVERTIEETTETKNE